MFPEAGRLEIVGALDVALPTVNDCSVPSAALKFAPAPTCATKVHVPAVRNDTTPEPSTEHTAIVDDVTVFTPSPLVSTAGTNKPPTTRPAVVGRFGIVGALGVPTRMVND